MQVVGDAILPGLQFKALQDFTDSVVAQIAWDFLFEIVKQVVRVAILEHLGAMKDHAMAQRP